MSVPVSVPSPARSQNRTERVHFWFLLVGLAGLLLVSLTLAVVIGPVNIPAHFVWQIVFFQVFGGGEGAWSKAQFNIIWLIRLPRVLLALLVGAGLAGVGVTMQAAVRNSLADPYLLGISSGASVGAVTVLSFGVLAFAGVYAISLGAFLGALLTFVLVFLLAQSSGRLSPTRLVLAGLAVSYFLSGLTSFLTLTSANRELARAVLAWLLGSLAGARWVDLGLPAAVLLLGMLYLTLQARALNALIVGEETAATLGVEPHRLRRHLFLVASLLTGTMVAISGTIGFIGLMIPHVTRLMVGNDHRRVLPVSLFVGSIFLIWVDVIARTVFDPVELPVGVITALLGGPFFLWLLRSQLKQRGGQP